MIGHVDTIHLRGYDFSCREMGEGVPVLFVHGTLAGMDTFRRQLQWFGRRARAIAYSRRFHPPGVPGTLSQNERPPGEGGTVGYALDEHAADLIALVDALGGGRPHVVGSSYGAYVAIRACLMKPGLAASLVAAEPPMLRLLELHPEGRAALARFRESGLDPARAAFERGDIESGVACFFDGIRGEQGAFASLTSLQRSDLLRFGPELRLELTSDFDAYMPPISLDQISTLAAPTLFLTGEKSPPLFHLIIDSLHAALPGSQVKRIPGADHSIHTSASAGYNEAAWAFISARA
jgi:pimeloyl-ACP methyl ester carboxylesterase